MKYKVGDRVKIKSLDWYNKNRDEFDEVPCKGYTFVKSMVKYCNMVLTIKRQTEYGYCVKENSFNWTDEMFEGLAEEETKPNIIEEAKTYWDSIKDAWICPEGYIFKDENGNVINATKIVLEKKKKEYPKTYEECCKILGVDPDNYLTIRNVYCYDGEEETIKYEQDLLDKFDSLWELRICRDAYWKIAGDEMGFGKPWEPDWTNQELLKYCIANVGGQIKTSERYVVNTILAFPTEEMRDAFKKNFDPDIEFCKEFL